MLQRAQLGQGQITRLIDVCREGHHSGITIDPTLDSAIHQMQLDNGARGGIPKATVETADFKGVSNGATIRAQAGLEGPGEIARRTEIKTGLIDNQRRELALPKADSGIVVVDLHIQLYGWRHIAIEVEHAHGKALANLVSRAAGIGISVIEGVITERVSPISRPINGKHTVLALDHATIGHIDKVAVDILDLQG